MDMRGYRHLVVAFKRIESLLNRIILEERVANHHIFLHEGKIAIRPKGISQVSVYEVNNLNEIDEIQLDNYHGLVAYLAKRDCVAPRAVGVADRFNRPGSPKSMQIGKSRSGTRKCNRAGNTYRNAQNKLYRKTADATLRVAQKAERRAEKLEKELDKVEKRWSNKTDVETLLANQALRRRARRLASA